MKRFNILTNSILYIFLAVLLIYSTRHLCRPNIAGDESVQFYISKGLSQDAPPFSEEGELSDVIQNNGVYNLDPGGFSILLHFWSKISNHPGWLRLIPWLFYLISILVLLLLFRQCFQNNFVVGVTIVFLITYIWPEFFYEAFNLRAYSMELVGSTLALYFVIKDKSPMPVYKILGWGLLFAMLSTSRYSAFVTIGICNLFFLKEMLNAKFSWKRKFLQILSFIGPQVMIYLFVLKYSFIPQKGDLKPLYYTQYLTNGITLDALNIIYFLCLIILSVYVFSKSVKPNSKLKKLATYTLLINLAFALLSIMNIHPWMPFGYHCISMSVLTFFICGMIVWEKAQRILDIQWVTIVLIFTLLTSIYIRRANFFILKSWLGNPGLYEDLQTLPPKKYNHVFVDIRQGAALKYLFEYGALKDRKATFNYPYNMVFQKFGPHKFTSGMTLHKFYKQTNKTEDFDNYDLVISIQNEPMHALGIGHQWKAIDKTTTLFVPKNSQ